MQEVIGSTPLCSTKPRATAGFFTKKKAYVMVLTICIIAYILIINIVAFFLYGIDKKRAINHEHRIPVSVLLWMARLGGGLGSWLGMTYFHHKKKHARFQIIVPLWITIWMFILVILLALGDGSVDELELFKSRARR